MSPLHVESRGRLNPSKRKVKNNNDKNENGQVFPCLKNISERPDILEKRIWPTSYHSPSYRSLSPRSSSHNSCRSPSRNFSHGFPFYTSHGSYRNISCGPPQSPLYNDSRGFPGSSPHTTSLSHNPSDGSSHSFSRSSSLRDFPNHSESYHWKPSHRPSHSPPCHPSYNSYRSAFRGRPHEPTYRPRRNLSRSPPRSSSHSLSPSSSYRFPSSPYNLSYNSHSRSRSPLRDFFRSRNNGPSSHNIPLKNRITPLHQNQSTQSPPQTPTAPCLGTDEPCRRFNSGSACVERRCRFTHRCSFDPTRCQELHAAINCHLKPSSS
jgi:hypothetical protein